MCYIPGKNKSALLTVLSTLPEFPVIKTSYTNMIDVLPLHDFSLSTFQVHMF